MRTVLPVLLILLAPGATGFAQEPLSKELTALQGRWLITHVGGEPVPSDAEVAFMLTGDEYVQGAGGQVVERGRMNIDGSTKPMTVDFTITAGRYANMVQLGIVEIVGDVVRFHLSEPGSKERPSDFTPRAGFELVTARKR